MRVKEFLEYLLMLPAILIFSLVILFVADYTNESPPTPEQIAHDKMMHAVGAVLWIILIVSVIVGLCVLWRTHLKDTAEENRPLTWAELKKRPPAETGSDSAEKDKIKMLIAVGIALTAAVIGMVLLG